MTRLQIEQVVKFSLALALFLNILFWLSVRDLRVGWSNIPPAPDNFYSKSLGLGDGHLAYRMNGIMLQNIGDTGGRLVPLDQYDYNRLTDWFFLQDHLDPKSNYTPYLAAFYFSGLQTPSKYRPVLDYLSAVGSRPDGIKWRWLVQGIWMARYKMNDLDKALELSNVLATTYYEDAPIWLKQMPAFILTEKGEKEAAYILMLEILRSHADKIHPNEVNAIRDYMCKKTLTQEEAVKNPLCENL